MNKPSFCFFEQFFTKSIINGISRYFILFGFLETRQVSHVRRQNKFETQCFYLKHGSCLQDFPRFSQGIFLVWHLKHLSNQWKNFITAIGGSTHFHLHLDDYIVFNEINWKWGSNRVLVWRPNDDRASRIRIIDLGIFLQNGEIESRPNSPIEVIQTIIKIKLNKYAKTR